MSIDWGLDAIELLRLQRAGPEVTTYQSSEWVRKFVEFRIAFLQEELDESKKALIDGSADGFVDGLIDLCVVAVGTLVALGVDVETAWDRVQAANIAKLPGVNPNRSNPLGLPDLIKPPGWTAPSHEDNVGCLQRVLNEGGAL